MTYSTGSEPAYYPPSPHPSGQPYAQQPYVDPSTRAGIGGLAFVLAFLGLACYLVLQILGSALREITRLVEPPMITPILSIGAAGLALLGLIIGLAALGRRGGRALAGFAVGAGLTIVALYAASLIGLVLQGSFGLDFAARAVFLYGVFSW